MGNLNNLIPLPRGWEGANPEAIIWPVDYFGQNGYLETFIERIFEKKISRKLVALRSIMALKKDSRTSYFKSK